MVRERGEVVAPAVVHEVLASVGTSLPAEWVALTRAELGFDGSRVRVHTDARAAASARVLGALAYTVGRHIAFAEGRYAPGTRAGRELLRHELQHAAEQGDASVPGVGGLRVDAAHEGTAEAAERSGFVRGRAGLGVRLQRKVGPEVRPEARPGREPAAAVTELAAELRAALKGLDGPRAVGLLRRLPAGAGEALARAEPQLRRVLSRVIFHDRRERLHGLALLSGAALDEDHVRVAEGLLVSRRLGAQVLLEVAATTRQAREVEAAFDRGLFDGFAGRPTLIANLRGGAQEGLEFARRGGLIVGRDVPVLAAWMRLDHEAAAAEGSGLRAAERGHEPLVADLRAVSAGGSEPAALRAFADEWEQRVRLLRGWQRPALALAHGWCLLGLEALVAELVPHGPREQVDGFFAGVRRARAVQAEAEDFAAQVAAVGRPRALQRVAQDLQWRLRDGALSSAITGDDAAIRVVVARAEARLGAWQAGDLQALDQAYERLTGRTLARTLRGLQLRSDEQLALLGLLTTGTRYDPHVRVAQALFRVEPAEAHVVLYGLPDAVRPTLHRDYQRVFSGLVAGDGEYTPFIHAIRLLAGKRQWEREKTGALLDSLLTQAEELYFHTLPLHSANLGDARKLFEAVRTGGRASYRQLHEDWEQRVRRRRGWLGRPLAEVGLREAMARSLSGEARLAAESVFSEYADALTGAAPAAGTVRIGDLAPALRAFDLAVFSGKTGQIKREVTHLAGVVKGLRAADGSGRFAGPIAAAERRMRGYLEAQVATRNLAASTRADALASYGNAGTLADADEIYRQAQLRLVLGGNEDAANAILAVVTRRWAADTLEALRKETLAPTIDAGTGEVLRPGFALEQLTVRFYGVNGREADIYDRLGFMLGPRKGRAGTGAMRLYLELDARSSSTAERLGGALGFIGQLSAGELTGVLESFNEMFAREGSGSPAERFIDHLVDRFALAREVPAIADKVRPAAGSPEEVLRRARLAEGTRHTAVLGGLGAWLAGSFGGRDLRPAIEQGLRNLEAIAGDSRRQPELLAQAAARAGRADGTALASAHYEDLKTFLAAEQQLTAEMTVWVQMLIEVGLRAALVAVFGPAGVVGLLIGVGTVAGGRVAAKGLLGANHDLLSPANIADVLTEVSGGLYELAKFEARIGRFVDKVVEGPFARQILSSGLTKVSTQAIDGAIERSIRQTGAPDFSKQIGVTTGAFAEAIGKVFADKVTFNVSTFSSFNERWLKQTVKQFISGPPPKASVIASGIGEVVKFVRDAQMKGKDEVDLEEVKKKLYGWVVNTFLTGSMVGASFSIHKGREAKQRGQALQADPEVLGALAGEHPLFKELLRAVPAEQRGRQALALAEDRSFGRAKLGAPVDVNAPEGRFTGQTLRRQLDDLVKLAAGKTTASEADRATARGDKEAAAHRAAVAQRRALALARALDEAAVAPGLRLRPRAAERRPLRRAEE